MQSQSQLESVSTLGKEYGLPHELIVEKKCDLQFLECPICLNILWKPIQCSNLSCGSHFCEHCIQKVVLPKCPKCREEFFKARCHPSINWQLSELKVRCVNDGCGSVISYDQYEKHLNQCDFKKMSCFTCETEFLQKDYLQHIKICEFVEVQCQQCKFYYQRKKFDKHLGILCLQNQLKQERQENDLVREQIFKLEKRLNMKFDEYWNKTIKALKGEPVFIPKAFDFDNKYFVESLPPFSPQIQRFSNNALDSPKSDKFAKFKISTEISLWDIRRLILRLQIQKLQGNIKIGFSSKQPQILQSVCIDQNGKLEYKIQDNFAIAQEEEQSQKLLKLQNMIKQKPQFSIAEGDQIGIMYCPFSQMIIQNHSQETTYKIEIEELRNILGNEIYIEFWLDTLGDAIAFPEFANNQ